jgi:hypothetical protein
VPRFATSAYRWRVQVSTSHLAETIASCRVSMPKPKDEVVGPPNGLAFRVSRSCVLCFSSGKSLGYADIYLISLQGANHANDVAGQDTTVSMIQQLWPQSRRTTICLGGQSPLSKGWQLSSCRKSRTRPDGWRKSNASLSAESASKISQSDPVMADGPRYCYHRSPLLLQARQGRERLPPPFLRARPPTNCTGKEPQAMKTNRTTSIFGSIRSRTRLISSTKRSSLLKKPKYTGKAFTSRLHREWAGETRWLQPEQSEKHPRASLRPAARLAHD